MRERVALAFEDWGAFVARHPWPVLLLSLASCAASISQLPRIEVDTTVEGFLHADDPALVTYDDFRARFGRDDAIVLGIDAPDLFSAEFLERLERFHEELDAEVPYVDEITSMLNARWTRGEDDQLVVEDLVAERPTEPAELAALRERVLSHPLYTGTLISTDAGTTTVRIDLDTYVQEGVAEDGTPILRYMSGEESREVVEAVSEVIARHDDDKFRLYAAGTPWMADRLFFHLMGDLPRLTRAAVLLIATLLFVLFRRVAAVLLPILVVALTVATTFGLAGLLGIPYQAMTQIVPVSLLAIGVGDSVHILTIYYQRRDRGEDCAAAIAGALWHSGPSVLMTSVTTAAALLAFLSSDLLPIANIGILAPLGVMIALGLSVTVVPALLCILPERDRGRRGARLAFLDRALVGAGDWSVRRPWVALGAAAVLTVVALLGTAKLRFSHDPVRWFPASDQLRVATEHLNERMGGVLPVEVLFETGRKDALLEPDLLAKLDRITTRNPEMVTRVEGVQRADGTPEVDLRIAKTISIVDLLKEINRALNENRAEAYVMPDTRELVAQELLLFELSGSDDLEDFADYEYRTARMTMLVPWIDATGYPPFLDALLAEHRAEVGADVQVQATGRLPLLSRTLTAVISSMARSYVLAFAAVTPLMILILGRVRLGLLAMIPNVLPIVAALGMLGWCGWPLDSFSLLTGSIVLGLSVDDTIHFMNGFGREYAARRDARAAVRETLATTGRALFFTTLILCCGFLAFLFGYMRNPVRFGAITAFSLSVALVADLMVAPALVTLATRGDDAGEGH